MLNNDLLELTYRYLTKDDLSFVLSIEESSNPHPWTKTNFLDCLEKGHYCILQLYNDKPSGFAIQSIAIDEAHLLNIGVDINYRRIGLGVDLLEQILYASQTLGCLRIFLEVRKSNLTAISLYQKRGFKKLSIRKNYYKLDKSREDAIVMSKNIRNSWKNLFFK